MPLVISFVLLILAVYRLAYMISQEEGPFGIFERLRIAGGAYSFGEDGRPQGWIGRGLTCPLCVGFWLSGLVVILVLPSGWFTLVYWLAVAGGQTALERSTLRGCNADS